MATYIDRVAALLVALDMARYKGDNDFARAHFAHYTQNFGVYAARAHEKAQAFAAETRVDSFHAGDFREQVGRAVEHGGGVAAFPPTYKGGYERIYKFLDANTAWSRPSYDVWDPEGLEPWVQELETAGVRYCVIADKRFETMEPVAAFHGRTNKPVFVYARADRSSLRRNRYVPEPFSYEVVDPGALTEKTRVSIVPATNQKIYFLRSKYLSRSIDASAGTFNFMVFLDGKLAGAFMLEYYNKKYLSIAPGQVVDGQKVINLLSDFSVRGERRLAKLIAMLATGREVVSIFERRHLRRIEWLSTWVFTNHPVSMKYRGIFQLLRRYQDGTREKGALWYAGKVRDASSQEIYADWYRRFARRP